MPTSCSLMGALQSGRSSLVHNFSASLKSPFLIFVLLSITLSKQNTMLEGKKQHEACQFQWQSTHNENLLSSLCWASWSVKNASHGVSMEAPSIGQWLVSTAWTCWQSYLKFEMFMPLSYTFWNNLSTGVLIIKKWSIANNSADTFAIWCLDCQQVFKKMLGVSPTHLPICLQFKMLMTFKMSLTLSCTFWNNCQLVCELSKRGQLSASSHVQTSVALPPRRAG